MTQLERSPYRILIFTLFALAAPLAAQTPDEAAAREMADDWLALVDAGDFEASWTEAGRIFQRSVAQDGWTHQIAALRQQVGKAESREYVTAESMSNPPGAPPGDYVNIQYRSEFSSAGSAVEMVVLTREEGRGWRVVGYFLQPPTGD